jgi:hypothetical protein
LSVTGLVGISSSVVLVTAIIVLALSLDLLRWYHRHICQLLDPAYAVETVTKHARQSIDRIQKSVTHMAKVQYRVLTSEQKKEVNLSDIESIVYPQMPGYPRYDHRNLDHYVGINSQRLFKWSFNHVRFSAKPGQ